jgi:hypothetical protein
MPVLVIKEDGDEIIIERNNDYSQRASETKDNENIKLLAKFMKAYVKKVQEITGEKPSIEIESESGNVIVKHKKDGIDLKAVFAEIAIGFSRAETGQILLRRETSNSRYSPKDKDTKTIFFNSADSASEIIFLNKYLGLVDVVTLTEVKNYIQENPGAHKAWNLTKEENQVLDQLLNLDLKHQSNQLMLNYSLSSLVAKFKAFSVNTDMNDSTKILNIRMLFKKIKSLHKVIKKILADDNSSDKKHLPEMQKMLDNLVESHRLALVACIAKCNQKNRPYILNNELEELKLLQEQMRIPSLGASIKLLDKQLSVAIQPSLVLLKAKMTEVKNVKKELQSILLPAEEGGPVVSAKLQANIKEHLPDFEAKSDDELFKTLNFYMKQRGDFRDELSIASSLESLRQIFAKKEDVEFACAVIPVIQQMLLRRLDNYDNQSLLNVMERLDGERSIMKDKGQDTVEQDLLIKVLTGYMVERAKNTDAPKLF